MKYLILKACSYLLMGLFGVIFAAGVFSILAMICVFAARCGREDWMEADDGTIVAKEDANDA